MKTTKPRFTTVDEYIASFPEAVQKRMQSLRAAIHAAAPAVEEKINYGMAGFHLHGYLVYFAGGKNHLGVYAVGSAIPAFPELAAYAGPKGNLRFPYDQPFPLALLKKAVKFRAAENMQKAKDKAASEAAKKKKSPAK